MGIWGAASLNAPSYLHRLLQVAAFGGGVRIGAQQNVLVTFLSGSEGRVGTWAHLCQDGVHVCTGTHVRGRKGPRSRGLETLAVRGR